MDDDDPTPADALRRARSFGPVAEVYDRGRPSFPAEAAAWLAGSEPATVLELGAGTGKLTRALVELGHDVHATDPDPEMLAILAHHLPEVRVSEAGAEQVPLPDRSVDVVVAAQSFHWFDHARALAEVGRVLRPGGRVALAWNVRDERIPWVRRLGRLLGDQEQDAAASAEPLVLSELFGFVEDATFGHWQQIDRSSVRDLALSRSNVSTLPDDEREALLAEVVAFYDDFGRGMDGMQLPYQCRCFRASALERRASDAGSASAAPEHADDAGGSDRHDGGDPGDTEMLLIDFR